MNSACHVSSRIGFAIIFLSVIFVHLIQVSDTTEDDERWSAKYGNVPLTSGVWEYVFKCEEEKLKNISHQAHKRCFEVTPKVTYANATIQELFFPDNANLQPIKIDVIMYTVEGRHWPNQPDRPYHFFLTKGLEPDCVYYLMPMKMNNTKELHMTPDHICGLAMPPPASQRLVPEI